MDNKECSYTLFKQIIEKKILFMAMFIVGASITVIPLTMVPSQVDAAPQLIPQLTDCKTIDGKSNAECKQVQDRNDGSYDNCKTSSTANNCKINQKVAVSNNFVNSETEAKIYQEVNSLVDCDYSASYCLARTFNDATQNVDVKTYKESTTGVKGAIDFDIDQKATQKIATDGQDRFVSKNTLNQNFLATAKPSTGATSSNTATIDADGSDAHIDMYATQFNDECDDSTCTNTGTQTYDLQANGRSSIDASSNQGLQLYQTNNGCDDTDSGTVTIDCINNSNQLVRLVSGNPQSTTTGVVPNSDASIKFDTLGNMEVDQDNNCDFGQYDCRNTADTQVQVSALGTSNIKMDNIVQNVDSTNNCDDLNTALSTSSTNPSFNIGCENVATVFSLANSAGDGSITVTEGIQDAYQLNDCDNAACKNAVTLFAGLGASTTGGIDPVTGDVVADYSQESDQINECGGTANCQNQLQILYSAIAKDGASGAGYIESTSDQSAYQANYCYDQNCANSGILTNTVFAPTGSEVYSTVSQDLYQVCTTSSGPNCQNVNSLTISGSAVNNAFLAYTASQDIDNTSGTTQPPASISYSATATNTPYTPQPVTQQTPGTITNPQ